MGKVEIEIKPPPAREGGPKPLRLYMEKVSRDFIENNAIENCSAFNVFAFDDCFEEGGEEHWVEVRLYDSFGKEITGYFYEGNGHAKN